MKAPVFKTIMNVYPPYLGTGIRVAHVSPDYRRVDVEMKLRWYNRNYVGTHFGGNLASMTDPFFVLMLVNILGPDYRVLDMSGTIDFLQPARGRVRARFQLSREQIDEIVAATANGDKYQPVLKVNIVDEQNETVARVRKTLYVRRKKARLVEATC
ncbi:DUF4442 domain-containing protein [Marinobacter sediminum]|uniref:DUF4442 domain-containing protein n=1 Tax=Marinobacter sediminum TaxID=256323 RepID=UPI00202EFD4C|nr:DUF4442 domain-containing protein [Marinobacter sediminum]MCM0612410.1 DUF4442 domain-containing protein [Marinobacter sediminum]